MRTAAQAQSQPHRARRIACGVLPRLGDLRPRRHPCAPRRTRDTAASLRDPHRTADLRAHLSWGAPSSLAERPNPCLPSVAGQAIIGHTKFTPPGHLLPPWTGFAVFCGYAAATLIAAAIMLSRRDARPASGHPGAPARQAKPRSLIVSACRRQHAEGVTEDVVSAQPYSHLESLDARSPMRGSCHFPLAGLGGRCQQQSSPRQDPMPSRTATAAMPQPDGRVQPPGGGPGCGDGEPEQHGGGLGGAHVVLGTFPGGSGRAHPGGSISSSVSVTPSMSTFEVTFLDAGVQAHVFTFG